jgi:hypothetical protein
LRRQSITTEKLTGRATGAKEKAAAGRRKNAANLILLIADVKRLVGYEAV